MGFLTLNPSMLFDFRNKVLKWPYIFSSSKTLEEKKSRCIMTSVSCNSVQANWFLLSQTAATRKSCKNNISICRNFYLVAQKLFSDYFVKKKYLKSVQKSLKALLITIRQSSTIGTIMALQMVSFLNIFFKFQIKSRT